MEAGISLAHVIVSSAGVYDPEIKHEHKQAFLFQKDKMDNLFSRFSCWIKLQGSVVWILRFKEYCCRKFLNRGKIPLGFLTVSKLRVATLVIVKCIQEKVFPKEMLLYLLLYLKMKGGQNSILSSDSAQYQ